jgi:hypothetical protein
MTNRTVKMLGWAAGAGIVQPEITAVLDGETVFSGSVDAVEMTKENQDYEHAPTIFTFEVPMEFKGTKHMVISVAKSAVRFGQIVANYAEVEMGSIVYSTGPDIFLDVSEYNGDYVRDPRGEEVTINGEKQQPDRKIGKGTWHWTVTPGSTFEHTITFDKAGLLE